MNTCSVECRGMFKSFRRSDGQRLPVLDGVDFKAEGGAVTVIIGPSGCGKSTLLGIIAGLDTPDAGSVGFSPFSGERPPIGFVFQTPRLLPWRSVEDNIRLALRGAGVPAEECGDRVEHYLGLVNLLDFRRQFPLYLSGGQQQRVSLARAFAVEPPLVLMDEPFSSVDELTAVRLREETRHLARQQRRTTLYVTHNIYEAAFLGDFIVLLTPSPTRVAQVLRNPSPDERIWGDDAPMRFARHIDGLIRGGGAAR